MVNTAIYLNDILLNVDTITVNVFGTGGTGSHLIDKLAAIAYAYRETKAKGIQLTAYDFDIVSERNVGRSDFILGDTGLTKTQISVSKANLGYGLEWTCENPRSGAYVSANFNFICTDDAESRLKYIDQIFGLIHHEEPEDQPYYIFDIGNDKDFGQIILLDKDGKLEDIDRKTSTSETVGTVTCAEGLYDVQGLFVNQFMALCAAQMFWTFISEYYLEYSQLWINLGMMKIVSKLAWK